MQPPLHGGEGQPQEVGHARDGHILEVAQQQHHLELFRKLGQRVPDLRAPRVPLDVLFRIPDQVRRVLQDKAVDLRVPGLFAGGAVLPLPEGAVPRDRRQPRPEPLRIVELRQRLECQQERLLCQVVRLVRAQDLPRDGQHRRPEAPHQLVERAELPQSGGNGQVAVG